MFKFSNQLLKFDAMRQLLRRGIPFVDSPDLPSRRPLAPYPNKTGSPQVDGSYAKHLIRKEIPLAISSGPTSRRVFDPISGNAGSFQCDGITEDILNRFFVSRRGIPLTNLPPSSSRRILDLLPGNIASFQCGGLSSKALARRGAIFVNPSTLISRRISDSISSDADLVKAQARRELLQFNSSASISCQNLDHFFCDIGSCHPSRNYFKLFVSNRFHYNITFPVDQIHDIMEDASYLVGHGPHMIASRKHLGVGGVFVTKGVLEKKRNNNTKPLSYVKIGSAFKESYDKNDINNNYTDAKNNHNNEALRSNSRNLIFVLIGGLILAKYLDKEDFLNVTDTSHPVLSIVEKIGNYWSQKTIAHVKPNDDVSLLLNDTVCESTADVYCISSKVIDSSLGNDVVKTSLAHVDDLTNNDVNFVANTAVTEVKHVQNHQNPKSVSQNLTNKLFETRDVVEMKLTQKNFPRPSVEAIQTPLPDKESAKLAFTSDNSRKIAFPFANSSDQSENRNVQFRYSEEDDDEEKLFRKSNFDVITNEKFLKNVSGNPGEKFNNSESVVFSSVKAVPPRDIPASNQIPQTDFKANNNSMRFKQVASGEENNNDNDDRLFILRRDEDGSYSLLQDEKPLIDPKKKQDTSCAADQKKTILDLYRSNSSNITRKVSLNVCL